MPPYAPYEPPAGKVGRGVAVTVNQNRTVFRAVIDPLWYVSGQKVWRRRFYDWLDLEPNRARVGDLAQAQFAGRLSNSLDPRFDEFAKAEVWSP